MPAPTPTSKYISITQAAEILGLGNLAVRRRIARGELAAYRLGTGPRAPIRLDLAEVVAHARPLPAAAMGSDPQAVESIRAAQAALKARRQRTSPPAGDAA